MSVFERYLSVWIALAILARTAIGSVAPSQRRDG
jgi:ACR3 family arsenite efflux pump ArsB